MSENEYKPANHWFHIPVLVVGWAFWLLWRFHLPDSGKALLLLGGVVAVMMLADMRPLHKGMYVFLIIGLVLTENRALDKERNDSFNDRRNQNQQFQTIATELRDAINQERAAIEQGQSQFTTTMSRFDSTTNRLENVQRAGEKTAELSKKNLEYATGGEEYCYLFTSPPFPPNLAPPGRWPVFIQNSGNVPLPSCNISVMERPVHGDSPEEIVRKFQSNMLLRFPNLPPKAQGGQPFPGFSIVPGRSYTIRIDTPTQMFVEELTCIPNSALAGGCDYKLKVFPGNADKNTKPLLDK